MFFLFTDKQTDLEDAKVLEVAKLQEALHTMRSQLKESTVMVLKGQEAARKAIEEASLVNKEPVVVEDTEKISSLSNEIEKLKVNNLHLYIRIY